MISSPLTKPIYVLGIVLYGFSDSLHRRYTVSLSDESAVVFWLAR
jgi:hypothetical protein